MRRRGERHFRLGGAHIGALQSRWSRRNLQRRHLRGQRVTLVQGRDLAPARDEIEPLVGLHVVAPAGTRAEGRCQARAAIDSTSFHAGKRPVTFFE